MHLCAESGAKKKMDSRTSPGYCAPNDSDSIVCVTLKMWSAPYVSMIDCGTTARQEGFSRGVDWRAQEPCQSQRCIEKGDGRKGGPKMRRTWCYSAP